MREKERLRGGNTGAGRSNEHDRDPRVWNREEYRRLEHESFSVFVDHLPEDISKRELYQLFNWTGRINDIYLSRKRKNGDLHMFAFIRYTTKGGALKAIAEMNRMRLRGKIVGVGEAKYRRPYGASDIGTRGWRDDIQNPPKHRICREEGGVGSLLTVDEFGTKDNVKNMDGHGNIKRVEAVVRPENLEWLQRSLVGVTLKPIDFFSLRETIASTFPSVVQVREMGVCKAILTFDSLVHAEETYTFKLNSLLQVFHRVWKWKESERSETRRVWLECFGVPLSAWSVDTFNSIGSLWGTVIGCAQDTEFCSTFTTGRVQIDTCVMEAIQQRIHLLVGSGEYDVLVKEAIHDDNKQFKGVSFVTEATNCECYAFNRIRQSITKEEVHDEGLMMVVQRCEEEDKDSLVNSGDILNEWLFYNGNHNRENLGKYQADNGINQALFDFEGGKGVSYDEDSDRTITCALGSWGNGLERNTTKKKQKHKYIKQDENDIGPGGGKKAAGGHGVKIKNASTGHGFSGLGQAITSLHQDPDADGTSELLPTHAQHRDEAAADAPRSEGRLHFEEALRTRDVVPASALDDGAARLGVSSGAGVNRMTRRKLKVNDEPVCYNDANGEGEDPIAGHSSTGLNAYPFSDEESTHCPKVKSGGGSVHSQGELRTDSGHDGEGFGGNDAGYAEVGNVEEEGDKQGLKLEDTQALVNRHTGGTKVGSEPVTGRGLSGEDKCFVTQAEQMQENEEEEDIMGGLKAQNENIAAKRKMAKQREKVRRSRPKNKYKLVE